MNEVETDDQAKLTESENRRMLEEVMAGIRRPQKKLPSKLFYDKRGSEVFEQICLTEEYYLTDTELHIMEHSIHEIVETLGPGTDLIELGSGSSYKTRLLLDHLAGIRTYIPLDISDEFLRDSVHQLREEYPHLHIIPVTCDYTQTIKLPAESSADRKVIYYPGSTIGNFTPAQARRFLLKVAEAAGEGGGLLIAADLKKDSGILEAAYNDTANKTAEFNKNILIRLNREFEADFNPDKFTHHAFFNEKEGRIEMHLVSREDQQIHIAGDICLIREGESIHTENSYKYTLEEFTKLTEGLFRTKKIWTDESDFMSIQYLEVIGHKDK